MPYFSTICALFATCKAFISSLPLSTFSDAENRFTRYTEGHFLLVWNATVNQNVDPEEIAKFEALAARWWDLHSEFKPLHAINPLRIGWIDERAHLHGKKVADIGCGGGIVAEAMALRGATVTGIDMGEAPLKVAQLHSIESGVEVDYRQMTAEQLAEEEAGLYDVVTCLEMLEHVPDPSAVVEACAKLLKPGGQAFFSTINRNPKSYLFAIIGAEYLLKMLPKGTHEHKKFIKPSVKWMVCNMRT